MSRGVLFLNVGTKYAVPLAVSLATLRQHYSDPVAIICDPDVVYIDGSHDKDSVAQDIQAWLPLVRPGGILAGHDYVDEHLGVIEAVNRFAVVSGWPLYVTREHWGSWFFEIPK